MRLFLSLLGMACLVEAQQGGFISGVVRERSGALIAGADIRVQNEATGATQHLTSDSKGLYSTTELTLGAYQLTARREGFRTTSRDNIVVAEGKTTRADMLIQLLPLQQEVTVTATESRDDPMVSGVTASRDTPSESLPANGRDVHALFSLLPGAVIAPASITAGGQFTVGGQRPNQNSFRVDGLSGNVGIGITSVPGAFPGGSLPSMTTIGGTQSLASKEDTERVELRSADFAAQYGDRPGAQVDIQTRAGSNDLHGSVFGYVRPHSLDSSDWFARGAASDLPTASVNGWGGSGGGPVWRNHLFLFASFERTDVHDSALQLIPVPSSAAYQQAGPAYQAILDAFPQPTGRPLTTLESVGYSPLRKAAGVTNASGRLDQTWGSHVHLFGRYTYVPSVSTSIELGTAYSDFLWRSVSAGLDLSTSNYTQQLRFNFSSSKANAVHGPSDNPSLNLIKEFFQQSPALVNGSLTQFSPIFYGDVLQVSIGGIGQAIDGQAGGNTQNQLQGAYLAERNTARQDIRVGGDYIELYNREQTSSSSIAIASPSINALLAGVPLGLTGSSFEGPAVRTEHSSAFAQDTIHLRPHFDLLLGIRWEYTPTPYSYPDQAPTFFSLGDWQGIGSAPNLIASELQSSGSRWPTRYNQFAPRLGLAWRLGRDVVMRAGAGIFYDTQAGSIISNENPLTIWQYLPTTTNQPINGTLLSSTTLPVLYLPRVLEWRTSLEKSLREGSLLSLSYFGSASRRLLRNEATIDPATSILQSLAFTSNGKSNYEALLAQYRANITARLYTQVSYTWSHSIDNGSSDTEPFLVQTDVPAANARGASNFDVRQVLTASLAYRLGKWNLSGTFFARSGFPFDVTTVDRSIGLGFDNSDRVNLIAGVPIWISNSSAAGGRELNPAAFSAPSGGLNGTLGRNALVGDGLFQTDISLRRQFHLFQSATMEASLSAFNLLNHPAFSSPVSYFGSALFGQSTSTANLMLGSGSPTTGLTPLYQAGGPRTVELGLRFSF